jgi:Protein of unknown function (DUF3306)
MSGGEDKGFISRWSQRKQEAKQPEPKPDEPVVEASPLPQPSAETEPEPEFDLSSLPKLEEMTGTTDITGFLRKGVPEQLRNAALRQSWALDPAIRNYVNPALEYAYDWNTPGGVPGSSEIGAGMDVARLVSQIMGTGESVAGASEPAGDPATRRDDPAQTSEPEAAQTPVPDLPTQSLRRGDEGASVAQKPGTEAAQAGAPDADHVASQHPVRRHGSAKPLV